MDDTISSRTPEGRPGRCPICEAVVCIEPSGLTGDAPCPQCGQLLWFVVLPTEMRLYPLDEIPEEKRQRLAEILDAFGGTIQDSLDVVELVMDLDVVPEDPNQIQSLGDLLDYFLRHPPDEDDPHVL
jgi:acyl carrier protein